MWRRRYASVVVLLLTCLINLCYLTLIGRRRVKSQLLFFSCLLVLHCLFPCFYQQYKIATQLVSVISLRLLILYCEQQRTSILFTETVLIGWLFFPPRSSKTFYNSLSTNDEPVNHKNNFFTSRREMYTSKS